MSLLIKDMEMPETCGNCAVYFRIKTLSSDRDYEFCGLEKRDVSHKTKPDWCPLSEVPEILQCKNCKHMGYRASLFHYDIRPYCHVYQKTVEKDDFCSRAERKSDA